MKLAFCRKYTKRELARAFQLNCQVPTLDSRGSSFSSSSDFFSFIRWFVFCSCVASDSHISYFMMPTSIFGLALPWAMLSQLEGTSRRVFHVRVFVFLCTPHVRSIPLRMPFFNLLGFFAYCCSVFDVAAGASLFALGVFFFGLNKDAHHFIY